MCGRAARNDSSAVFIITVFVVFMAATCTAAQGCWLIILLWSCVHSCALNIFVGNNSTQNGNSTSDGLSKRTIFTIVGVDLLAILTLIVTIREYL